MAIINRREMMRQAQRALDTGRPREAVADLWSLLDRAHVPEEEARAALRLLQQAYVALDRGRAAATVALHLGDPDTALRLAQGWRKSFIRPSW